MTPRPYSEARARRETQWVRNSLTDAFFSLNTAGAQIRRIYAGRGHEALGYASWEAYVETEFGDLRARLTRADREFLHVELTKGEAPLSRRAVAAVTGASPATVSRDARAQVSHGETPAAPAAVRGLDGKTYTCPEPRPEPVVVAVVQFGITPDQERAMDALDRLRDSARFLTTLPPEVVCSVITREEWEAVTRWPWEADPRLANG
jgi:hypothetical protein